jgi:hypothetical protein
VLRKSGYDCRAGNHGHKRESNQNFVHLSAPSGETPESLQAPRATLCKIKFR